MSLLFGSSLSGLHGAHLPLRTQASFGCIVDVDGTTCPSYTVRDVRGSVCVSHSLGIHVTHSLGSKPRIKFPTKGK